MPKATALKRGDEPSRPKPRRVEIEFILDRCGTERISICGNFNS